MKDKIYKYLSKIDYMNSDNYNYLIDKYDEKMVNSIIEEMIEHDSSNLKKFKYYVNNIMVFNNSKVNAAFDAYLAELSCIETNTNSDNINALKDINNIIVKIDEILSKYLDVNKFTWISDRIDWFLKNCSNIDDLVEIKKLYNVFCNKRNDIVNGNLRFVIYVAKKFSGISRDFAGLVQYGNLGLMIAIEKYDISYNNTFTTYAYYWIMQSIIRNGSMENVPISISHSMLNLNVSVRRAEKELSLLYNRKPTNEEIAAYLNISISKINEVNCAFCNYVSINEELTAGDSGDTYVDFISDDNVDVEKSCIDSQMADDVREVLKDCLTEREYEIICHRYCIGDYEFKRLEELGLTYGLTRERIRQIESKSLEKLKVKAKSLKTYIEG